MYIDILPKAILISLILNLAQPRVTVGLRDGSI